MITTIHIQCLLLLATNHHPNNPAVLRLPEEDRTVGGLGLAYLPRRVYCVGQEKGVIPFSLLYPHLSLDLTDPGTTRGLVNALALGLGLDPGELGMGAAWRPGYHLNVGRSWWGLSGPGWDRYYVQPHHRISDDDIIAADIAAEPNHIKALTLAVMRLLENP